MYRATSAHDDPTRLHVELDKLRKELYLKDRELAQLQHKPSNARPSAAESSFAAEIDSCLEAIRVRDDRIQRLQAQLEGKGPRHFEGRTGDETVGAQRRIVALQEEVTQIEKEKLDLSTQVRTLERQLQVRDRTSLNKVQEQKDEVSRINTRLQHMQSEWNRDKALASEEKVKLNARLQAVQNEFEREKAAHAQTGRLLKDKESQLRATQQQLRDREQEVKQAKQEVQRLEHRLQDVTNQLADKHAEASRMSTLTALQGEVAATTRTISRHPSEEDMYVRHQSPYPSAHKSPGRRLVAPTIRPSGGYVHRQESDSDHYVSSGAGRDHHTLVRAGKSPGRGSSHPRKSSLPSNSFDNVNPVDRLEAALAGIGGPAESYGARRPAAGRSSSPHSTGRVGPGALGLRMGSARSRSMRDTETEQSSPRSDNITPRTAEDPLLKTYPHTRHTAFSKDQDPVSSRHTDDETGRYLMGSRSRMASPSRDDRMTNTISYPVTRSLSPANPSTDELRAELEAVKRETARLRRELV
uniref:Uncharacterized protein n=1 Tax=Eutreptiella gymnastica TaxID=73025 RepID=A0A7S4LHA0_9EUGL